MDTTDIMDNLINLVNHIKHESHVNHVKLFTLLEPITLIALARPLDLLYQTPPGWIGVAVTWRCHVIVSIGDVDDIRMMRSLGSVTIRWWLLLLGGGPYRDSLASLALDRDSS